MVSFVIRSLAAAAKGFAPIANNAADADNVLIKDLLLLDFNSSIDVWINGFT
jgi:uncharacterized membrane protein YtjA (UPF0391 family)